MDFSFTQEQQMLRDGFGKYLEKSYNFDAQQTVIRSDAPWSVSAWSQYGEFGLLALPFSEEAGGLGGSIADLVAISELMGKHLTVEPYVSCVMLAGGALAGGGTQSSAALLEQIMAGDTIAAFAYEEGAGTAAADMISMRADPDGEGYRLSGEKRLVIGGAEASMLVVAARIGGDGPLGLFLTPANAPGIDIRGYRTIDGVRAANIRFDGAATSSGAALIVDAPQAIDDILNRAMIVQCAEAVGAMGALLAMTCEYAATRKQFGVPIASFQAVSHRIADMKIAYSKARATLIYTAALAESAQVGARDIATLKGQTGKLGREIGEAAIQTHGGVGMTDELSVSHYYKRLLALDAQFGGHAYHLRRLGQR